MHSYTEENYLKALFNLANEKGEVSANELSKKLEIKMPTVNSMMKKLADKKLVHYESYKPLKLTEKGKKDAGLIIRKHRLMEMFLVEKMGFGWEEVHEDVTRVTFRSLTARDLAHYLASREWEGRAGAYAIQGLGASLVERIEGDFWTVVGLPAALLVRLLAERFPGVYGFG
jgi:Mn-dependent DtxR family transcriptional regulator